MSLTSANAFFYGRLAHQHTRNKKGRNSCIYTCLKVASTIFFGKQLLLKRKTKTKQEQTRHEKRGCYGQNKKPFFPEFSFLSKADFEAVERFHSTKVTTDFFFLVVIIYVHFFWFCYCHIIFIIIIFENFTLEKNV